MFREKELEEFNWVSELKKGFKKEMFIEGKTVNVFGKEIDVFTFVSKIPNYALANVFNADQSDSKKDSLYESIENSGFLDDSYKKLCLYKKTKERQEFKSKVERSYEMLKYAMQGYQKDLEELEMSKDMLYCEAFSMFQEIEQKWIKSKSNKSMIQYSRSKKWKEDHDEKVIHCDPI